MALVHVSVLSCIGRIGFEQYSSFLKNQNVISVLIGM